MLILHGIYAAKVSLLEYFLLGLIGGVGIFRENELHYTMCFNMLNAFHTLRLWKFSKYGGKVT